MHQFQRTELLIGKSGLEKLAASHVAIFGVGGVGGYVVEALARSGIGEITLVDSDDISLTNLNRQIIATHETIGRSKVVVMAERIASINPNCKIHLQQTFFLPENADQFNFQNYDYVIDAVDTVAAKISLVLQAQKVSTPIISSMGTGNKMNPAMFEVADIYQTSVCPLARVMRQTLKKHGVKKLKVVYSKELPIEQKSDAKLTENINKEGSTKRAVPGSTAFCPPVAGLIIASEVVKDLLK
ncbi:MAG: tRNA threonylcarbamoyladenosine dehydratase [Phascolarctobacterium sp.]|nr:tRNA threonylcarbamoyladenosine dehydratase [Phascolarctobacterium sp.]